MMYELSCDDECRGTHLSNGIDSRRTITYCEKVMMGITYRDFQCVYNSLMLIPSSFGLAGPHRTATRTLERTYLFSTK